MEFSLSVVLWIFRLIHFVVFSPNLMPNFDKDPVFNFPFHDQLKDFFILFHFFIIVVVTNVLIFTIWIFCI